MKLFDHGRPIGDRVGEDGLAQSEGADLAELRELSARLGNDITRTQGAGGNTSIKQDGIMWVKASGTWLSHARERDIFVPVSVPPLVEALRAGDPRADKATDFVLEDLNVSALRPSIETSVHAVIPQAVVAHFHCVHTIAHGVVDHAERIIAERLAGLAHVRWAMIPYRRPGMPLAQEIEKVAGQRFDVLILQNHGLVVAGESVAAVSRLIEEVTAALAIAPRQGTEPDLSLLEVLSRGTAYHPPGSWEIHAVALDPDTLRIAQGGPLYPDHVIFLGDTLGEVGPETTPDEFATYAAPDAPKLIVVPGKGVLVSKSLSEGGLAMARCLTEVTTRVDAEAGINYLDADQVYALTHWEAEQYRHQLDQRASTPR